MIWLILLACGPDGSQLRQAPTEPPGDDSPLADSDLDEPSTHTGETDEPDPSGACPAHMAPIEGFCIDRYEAHLLDHSPYEIPPPDVVAQVAPGRVPQAYISGNRALEACENAGKRLCTRAEWLRACQGPTGSTYPYGSSYDPDACNVSRAVHPLYSLFGSAVDWSPGQMNDPRINQQEDTVDAGGDNPDCVSAEGVYDLHGNLHEWISEPSGEFRGGFYMDAAINGAGCLYRTTAHTPTYHDYSTGFRCCSDPAE